MADVVGSRAMMTDKDKAYCRRVRVVLAATATARTRRGLPRQLRTVADLALNRHAEHTFNQRLDRLLLLSLAQSIILACIVLTCSHCSFV